MAFQAQKINENFEVNLNKLDESQRAAVEAPGQNIVIKAAAGSGKALLNGTKVLTEKGWKSIELLNLTDKVAAEDGKFYKLLGIYPQGKKQIYEVEFSDGSIIKCSPDHLWTWQTSDQRNRTNKWQTNTIEEISHERIKLNNGHWNIYIPQTKPIDLPKQELPLDSYLLGALLGDGNISDKGIIFTVAEEDIKNKINNILQQYNCSLKHINRYDYSIQGEKGFGYHNIQDYVGATITSLGLRGLTSETKFIPQLYKFSSIEQRLALLQGIIDTDGYCTGSGYDICLKSKQLILDIKWLCESLGATARYSEKDSYCSNSKEGHKKCNTVYRLQIKCSNEISKIHSSIKREKQWKKGQSSARRTIRKINKIDEYAEMTCIEIQSPNHLFLTENCIPTHNTSTLITAIAAYRYERLNDRICAITYTRAARAEMEERLNEMGIYDVEVTTIHVWARNLLHDLSIKYNFTVRVLEEYDIKTILEDLVSEYQLRRGGRSRTRVNIGILYSFITGNKQMDITDGYRRTLKTLEAQYIEYKRDNNLYDFTDYPLYLYDVMETYDEYVRNIDALFVDEFQDVDSTQFEIFKKVLSNKKFYIGDAWQSIFQFRGADGAVFAKLEDFDSYSLDYNYRSYQEIIDYACTMYEDGRHEIALGESTYITNFLYSHPSKITCSRGYGGSVTIIDPFRKGVYNYNKLSKFLGANEQLQIFSQMLLKVPMILCRTNKQVKAVQDFGYSNVSTIHQAKGLEYDNVIVIDTEIANTEDLNIAYVALTRAKNNLLVMNWSNFEQMWRQTHKVTQFI